MNEEIKISFSFSGPEARLYRAILDMWKKFPMFDTALLNKLIFKKGIAAFYSDGFKDMGFLPEEMREAFEKLSKDKGNG